MTALIMVSVVGAIFVLITAFMAGCSPVRKNALLWSAAGVICAVLAGITTFFSKAAVKEILLKRTPHLAFMAEELKIPTPVMIKLGLTAFVCGLIIFLWSFNCRKNCSKWYWALLWSIGTAFLAGHLLFLVQYCGIAAWVNVFIPVKQDVFELDLSILPAFYLMLGMNLIFALAWTWHTVKTAKHSWKNILAFAGIFTVWVSLIWLSACGVGAWAKNAMESKAAALGITPLKTPQDDPDELKKLNDLNFITRHAKYNPPRSGRYDWSKDTIPADEKEYTMKFFTSPELEAYLANLKKIAAFAAKKDVLYLSTLQNFRSLVRHRADIAELYYRTGQKEKILPELLKYPELESLIPADTPYLICELVRSATRNIWISVFIQYAPDEKSLLPDYRKLLAWSFNWQVNLPCEAGFYLTLPVEKTGALAGFFNAPVFNTARYRGFSDAVNKIPALKKLEQQEFIQEDGMFAHAAKRQRSMIVLGRTALALKVYQVEHGKYPADLSELVPAYLPEKYISPYSGKKLEYSVKNDTASNGEYFILSDGKSSFCSKK